MNPLPVWSARAALPALLLLLLLLLGLPAALPPAAAQTAAGAAPAPPVAAVRNVTETFFGTAVDDPYRWLEETAAPDTQAWMRAHSEHAHATLRAIAPRDALRRRLDQLESATPARVFDIERRPGELFFYQRRAAGEEQFRLFVRQGLQGAERLVFDPMRGVPPDGPPNAINWSAISPDGRLVALGVSSGGSEDAEMRLIEVATGRQLGPTIARTPFGASWSPDGRELYVLRLQALAPGQPATDKYQRSALQVMRPGGSEASLRTVVEAGRDLGIPATEFPFITVLPDGRVLLAAFDGVSPNFAAWTTTLAALRAGRPDWQPLATPADGVVSLALREGRVWALTFKDAPRYRLVSGPLQGFSVARAQVVVPESEHVLTGMAQAADALYLERREGNVKRLLRLSYAEDARPWPIALPVEGSFALGGGSAHPALGGLLIDLQGWNRARQVFAVDPAGRVSNTGLQPAGPFDAPDEITTTEVMVPSHDGVRVPLSIIHRKDVTLDGRNPTLLYGYASYGFTEEPFFSPTRLAWLEAGGVFAVANPRGSGVFGRDWHEAGKQVTKPNSWRDLIACAEWLVAERWTAPQRLAIWGGSAGGLLVGRAMTERPDLFAAVVPEVGVLDMVRAEVTPNGVPNIPEFGTRTTEPGFRALLAMSTYHQIRDGTAYPAVLLTHGVNDPRVEVWHSSKTAARLLAASTSGKPVLLRLDWQAGHGIGDTRSQTLDARADVFAFLLWQMGMPGWELRR
jgi:prolyl oligopeptidase